MTVDASRLGVDFGTSSTVAALAGPDGRARPLLFDSSPLLSSSVFIGPEAEPLTGADAERAGLAHPSGLEPNPKRRIDDGTVWLGEREVAVVDLIAAVLRRVAGEAIRVAGGLPGQVVLTYPAAWGQTRVRVLAEAALRAGLGRAEFVPEPVAAAAYFVNVLGRQIAPGRTLVVYDFGAGTFDVSVVRPITGGFQVVASAGLPDVGGLDLDAAVVGHARTVTGSAAEAWSRLDWPQTPADLQARHALWRGAKAAKEQLSRHPATDLHVPLAAVDTHLTREEFTKLSTPLLERTAALTLSVLRDAQVAPEQIGGIFLVGGSSRIPLAATLLHRTLRIAPTALDQPELVVAEGSLQAVAPPPSAPVSTPPYVPVSTPPYAPVSPGRDGGPPTVRLPGAPPGAPATALPPATAAPAAPASRGPSWKLLIGVVSAVVALAVIVGLVALKPWADKPITGAQKLTVLPMPTTDPEAINGVAFTPDGKLLATASDDKSVRFWSSTDGKQSGEPLRSFEFSVDGLAISPNGKWLATYSYDGVRIWDVKNRRAGTGAAAKPLTNSSSTVDDIRFSADGKTLWASRTDGIVLAWTVATGKPKGPVKHLFTDTVTSTLLGPDGKTLAANGSKGVQLYDVDTGKKIGGLLTNETGDTSFRTLAFSPDGKTLAGAASGYGITLWDVATRKPFGSDLTGHTGSITSLAFSSNGKTLASGSTDMTIRLWDISARAGIGAPLTGHKGEVDHLAFRPDDDQLASVGYEKAVRLWKLKH